MFQTTNQNGFVQKSNIAMTSFWDDEDQPMDLGYIEKYLVGGWKTILKKHEFVNGKDDIPYISYIMENKIHVWKHQPDTSLKERKTYIVRYLPLISSDVNGFRPH